MISHSRLSCISAGGNHASKSISAGVFIEDGTVWLWAYLCYRLTVICIVDEHTGSVGISCDHIQLQLTGSGHGKQVLCLFCGCQGYGVYRVDLPWIDHYTEKYLFYILMRINTEQTTSLYIPPGIISTHHILCTYSFPVFTSLGTTRL